MNHLALSVISNDKEWKELKKYLSSSNITTNAAAKELAIEYLQQRESMIASSAIVAKSREDKYIDLYIRREMLHGKTTCIHRTENWGSRIFAFKSKMNVSKVVDKRKLMSNESTRIAFAPDENLRNLVTKHQTSASD